MRASSSKDEGPCAFSSWVGIWLGGMISLAPKLAVRVGIPDPEGGCK